jgi:phage gpG-like protein
MKFTFDLGKAIGIKNPFKGSAYKRLKNNLLGLMIEQKAKVFKDETSPDGKRWDDLAEVTKRAREWRVGGGGTEDGYKKSKGKKAYKKVEASSLKTKKSKKVAMDRNSPYNMPILQNTGALRMSVSGKNGRLPLGEGGVNSTEGDEVVLGTGLPYADLQNKGGEITTDRNPFGGKLKQARTYTIPARPFIGISDENEKEVEEMIVGWIDRETGFEDVK